MCVCEFIIMISYLTLLAIYFRGSVLVSVVRFKLGADLARFRFDCIPNCNVCIKR